MKTSLSTLSFVLAGAGLAAAQSPYAVEAPPPAGFDRARAAALLDIAPEAPLRCRLTLDHAGELELARERRNHAVARKFGLAPD